MPLTHSLHRSEIKLKQLQTTCLEVGRPLLVLTYHLNARILKSDQTIIIIIFTTITTTTIIFATIIIIIIIIVVFISQCYINSTLKVLHIYLLHLCACHTKERCVGACIIYIQYIQLAFCKAYWFPCHCKLEV